MAQTTRGDTKAVAFFVISTFTLSWACWFLAPHLGSTGLYFKICNSWQGISSNTILTFLGNYTPGIVAIAILYWIGGRREVAKLVERLNPLRAKINCFFLAAILPFGILFASASMNLLTRGTDIPLPVFSTWIPHLLINLPFAPLWEELGWRGFLLPRLQATLNSFRASLLVGVIWGPWHAPLQLQLYKDSPNIPALLGFPVFCIFVLGLSVIVTWLYNRSRGFLLPCILFHGVLNMISPYFVEAAIARDGIRPILWATLGVCLTAGFLRIKTGENLGSESRALGKML
jgi:membrane protease YdiL (CAAX protease family)